jgi:hypothetical protein
LTLLDSHFGTIDEWRYAIDEIHKRGMYVILENTMSTMGDLIGFEGYLNETTPFSFNEHNAVWKSSRRYWDFHLGDDSIRCEYPRFWDEQGKLVGEDVTSRMTTCRTSDFDQVTTLARALSLPTPFIFSFFHILLLVILIIIFFFYLSPFSQDRLVSFCFFFFSVFGSFFFFPFFWFLALTTRTPRQAQMANALQSTVTWNRWASTPSTRSSSRSSALFRIA